MAAQLELTQKPFMELQIETLAFDNHFKQKKINKFISELTARILSIGDLNYSKLLNRTFRLPLVGRPNSLADDYPKDFKFVPPKRLHIIGGFQTSTTLKRTKYVDLAVEMPSNCIGQKDIKNQRYYHKRALYLMQLANLLNGSVGLGLVDKLEFRFFNGDLYKPVLLISPTASKLQIDVIFQMFVIPDVDEFNIKLASLRPGHGNVSPRWFFKDYNFETIEANDELRTFIESDSDACPSPFYNSSILFDAESVSNSNIISEHIIPQTSLSEATVITKIWLYQRELHRQFTFAISMFIAYLQTRQKIHRNMSSFQIFKIIIKSLIDTDWANGGMCYFEDHTDRLDAFKPHFPVVFLSPSGRLNLCYSVTLDAYNRLRHEARVAQQILASSSTDVFENLFLKKVDFINKFDVIVHLPKCTRKLPETMEYAKWLIDYGVATTRVLSRSVMNLVQKSMTDRIDLLQQDPNQLLLEKTWPIRGITYDPTNDESTLSFGLLLNAEKSLRIIDIGPKAQTVEAEEFRKFWNPKSQLRLQNGLISETVVWHVDSFSQRRAIIKYILDHAMKKAQISNVVSHHTQLEKFIDLRNVYFSWKDDAVRPCVLSKENENKVQNKKRKLSNGDDDEKASRCLGIGEEVYLKILNGYNELNKILRNIDAMKHSITSIQPVSHHLRSSSIFPPLPVSLQVKDRSLKRHKGVTVFSEKFVRTGRVLYIEPIDILVTLDSTSKWANDFSTLEAEKLEYLIALGEKLKSKEYTVRFAEDYIDILHRQFVFRVRVKCQKELSLVAQARGRLEYHKRRHDYEVMPRVHGALDQLYREKPAYSLTCRIVKRWISCHLMADYISSVTIDLLVAYLFLNPLPLTEPASSACGFKRFLQLMAKHNWEDEPIIVNLEGQLKLDEIKELRESIQKDRAKYPEMVICTPFDKDRPSPWTRSEPSGDRLKILVKICSKAVDFFLERILSSHSNNIDECRALFRPNFKLFDLIIKLSNNAVQTYFMSIDPPKDFRLIGKENLNTGPSAFNVMPIVNLNIIEQFVGILSEKHNDSAWFFYDKYGQRIIGVILKPEAQLRLSKDMHPFIAALKKLGRGLVDDISVIKRDK